MSKGLVVLKLSKRELKLLLLIVIYTNNPGVLSLLSESTDENYIEDGEALSLKLSKAWKSLSLSSDEKDNFRTLLKRIEKIDDKPELIILGEE